MNQVHIRVLQILSDDDDGAARRRNHAKHPQILRVTRAVMLSKGELMHNTTDVIGYIIIMN